MTGGTRFLPLAGWSLGALFFGYAFFQRVAPSVMVGELMSDFGITAAALGNLSAVYFYAYAGMQLPVGMMVDRWGARRLLGGAAVVCGLGGLLFATADSLGPAYMGRFLIGGGAGFAFVGTLKLAADWFPPRRFAVLTGFLLAAGTAGAVAGQAPLAAVVDAVGWRPTATWAALFGIGLGASIWLVVRDRHRAPAEDTGMPGGGLLAGLAGVIAVPQTWVLSVYAFSMTAPLLAFGSLWGVPFMMRAYGLERPAAALSTSLMLIGWGIGGPLVGWFSDHIGRRRPPMLLGALGGLATMAALVYLPELPLAAARLLLLSNGIFSAAMIVSFATVRENNRPRAAGVALGLVNTLVITSGAVLQPLIGWILDLGWSGDLEAGVRVYSTEAFGGAFLTLIACGILAVISASLVRETHCRQVL